MPARVLWQPLIVITISLCLLMAALVIIIISIRLLDGSAWWVWCSNGFESLG